MKAEELQKALIGFGLSDAEAKAFYHLSKTGESTATEVAKMAGLSRAEVYRAADGLEAQGLIERTVSRPQRFIPRAIDEALEVLLVSRRANLQELEAQRERLAQVWPKHVATDEAEEQRFKIQKGKTQLDGLFTRMIERAEREIAIAAPHRTVFKLMSWGLGPMLTAAHKRGLHVRIITQITEDLLDQPGLLPEGVEVRHSELPTYAQFLLVDQKEIAMYVTVDPVVGTTGRPETVLWLNSPDLTMGQQTMFDDMWMQGVDVEARKVEMKTGHLPHQMRVVRGRFPRVDEMRTIMARAKKSIFIAAPTDVTGFVTPRVEITIKRIAKKGVAVLLLTPDGESNVAGIAGVTVRKGTVDPRLGILVVDDKEALVVPLGSEIEGRDEHAVVATVPSVIELATKQFRAVWDKGG